MFFWELKDQLSRSLEYHASSVNTKERSSFYLLALKKTSYLIWTLFKRSPFQKFIIWLFSFFLLWTILSCKVHVFVIISFFLSFIESYVSFKHFKRFQSSLKGDIWTWIKKILFSYFFLKKTFFSPMLVTSKTSWSKI